MYEKYYGLTEKPFGVTPDPRFLFLSPHHREALAYLRYGIRERIGFVAIIGEVGTGKTTLLHALLNDLDSRTQTAFIFNTVLTAKALLRMMASDFGIQTSARTKTELLLDIRRFLLQQFAVGIKCVLVIDEAQNLNYRLLEEIRMLSNLETDREKLLQIVLVGQPELASKLAMPRLRQLRQRISARYRIGSLGREESGQYIAHRLSVAGFSQESLFSAEAIDQIHLWSGGIPRLINMICDRAMLLGYTRERRHIGLDITRETIESLAAQDVLQNPAAPAGLPDRTGTAVVPAADWRPRALRLLAAASGLILGAALFSLPLNSGESDESIPAAAVDRPVMSWAAPCRAMDNTILSSPHGSAIQPGVAGATGVQMKDISDRPADSTYSIHVASFQDSSRVRRMIQSLQSDGYGPIFTVSVELPQSGLWHRVMIGRYQDRTSASAAARDYISSGAFRYAQPRPLGIVQEDPQEMADAGGITATELSSSGGERDE